MDWFSGNSDAQDLYDKLAYVSHLWDDLVDKEERTEDDINKASVRDRTILLGTIYDKERLERGQSTSNVATILATAVIEAGKQWQKG